MKIRKGFVSNSSSSSFIVATSRKTSGKIVLTIKVDLKNYADKVITTEKELLKYLDYNYDWSPDCGEDDSWARGYYIKAKKALESGKTVYCGSFSDEGAGGAETMLCYEGLKRFVSEDDDIEIIHSEGGY